MPTYKIDINVLNDETVFDPNPLDVLPGDAIFWSNNTSQIHQPAMNIPGGVWNLVDQIPGTVGDQDPATSGIMSPPNPMTINYFCTKHKGETGTINVNQPPK